MMTHGGIYACMGDKNTNPVLSTNTTTLQIAWSDCNESISLQIGDQLLTTQGWTASSWLEAY